jgi:hypothetical protein
VHVLEGLERSFVDGDASLLRLADLAPDVLAGAPQDLVEIVQLRKPPRVVRGLGEAVPGKGRPVVECRVAPGLDVGGAAEHGGELLEALDLVGAPFEVGGLGPEERPEKRRQRRALVHIPPARRTHHGRPRGSDLAAVLDHVHTPASLRDGIEPPGRGKQGALRRLLDEGVVAFVHQAR